MIDLDTIDVDDLRADLREAEESAFALADELAASAQSGAAADVAALAANYVQARTKCRRLRSAIKVATSG